MSRIVITTWGSLGDLYPYLAIALELRSRGHEVIVATSECYRARIEALNLAFRSVRPDCQWLSEPDKVRHFSHPQWGLLRVGRELVMPSIPEMYDDIMQSVEGADLLLSMHASYAARLVAEKVNIPWVSAIHIPLVFLSAFDPPVMDVAPLLSNKFRKLGPVFWKPLLWFGKRATRFIASRWYHQRNAVGLPSISDGNPLFDSHSPLLVLALFSEQIAAKQPDWPHQSIVTGFPFYDDINQGQMPLTLLQFLDKGPPPLVFTLGSAVSGDAGRFYESSVECARILNQRAVIITSKKRLDLANSLPEGMIAADYAPFAKLFPRAAAIVHHGGVGTTGQGLRSGRPMLVVPFAWDQFDNAQRAVRLGVARSISKHDYAPKKAAKEIQTLLFQPEYAVRAREVAESVSLERGATAACDAIDGVLHAR